jgi:hypothetical protein
VHSSCNASDPGGEGGCGRRPRLTAASYGSSPGYSKVQCVDS